MNLLIIFGILFSTNVFAGEVERFEKRASGFEEHLARKEAMAIARLKKASEIREEREARAARYVEIRRTFIRRLWARDEAAEKRFQEGKEMRRLHRLEEQQAYARNHRKEIQIIDRKSASLKPREYNLESENK